jgi:hypothetical protein
MLSDDLDRPARDYTVEEALDLIPPAPYWRWTLCKDVDADGSLRRYRASVTWAPKGAFIDCVATGFTPAEAISAAALAARAQWETTNDAREFI